jgi:hypothetical protein
MYKVRSIKKSLNRKRKTCYLEILSQLLYLRWKKPLTSGPEKANIETGGMNERASYNSHG